MNLPWKFVSILNYYLPEDLKNEAIQNPITPIGYSHIPAGFLWQRWKKFFPFWEHTFAAEKFLQNFVGCENIKLFVLTYMLFLVVLKVQGLISEFICCIVASISVVKFAPKVSFSISKW